MAPYLQRGLDLPVVAWEAGITPNFLVGFSSTSPSASPIQSNAAPFSTGLGTVSAGGEGEEEDLGREMENSKSCITTVNLSPSPNVYWVVYP